MCVACVCLCVYLGAWRLDLGFGGLLVAEGARVLVQAERLHVGAVAREVRLPLAFVIRELCKHQNIIIIIVILLQILLLSYNQNTNPYKNHHKKHSNQ